ncbi:6352_t:CDS:10 [Rhizophagus irregularis]|nr:6352_t:CDS:10 [Rhizophagus irregularis]
MSSSKLSSSSYSSVYRSTPTSDNSTRLSAYGSRKYCRRTSSRASERSKSSFSSLPTRRPKTSASACIGGRDNHSFVVAMIEGRGVATEVGMCFIDLRTSECILSQTLHKLNLYNPVEIILSVTAIEPSKSKLCKILEDNMPMASIIPIGRKYFNDAIDCVTARNLELISNINNPRSNHSLYGILNNTRTPMGARLLRTNTLQPLSDVTTINMRLDAVEELIRHEKIYGSSSNSSYVIMVVALKPFQDIDHLITALIQVPKKPSVKHAEQSINNVIILKHTLKLINLLKESFTGVQNSLLDAIYSLLNDLRLEALEERINDVINEDITYVKSPLALRNQRCYAVRAGFNGLLDVARQTYKETVDDLNEMIDQYREQYQIPIKTQFSSTAGFYLSINIEQLEDKQLPLIFINVKKKRKTLTFTTLEVMKKNTKISDSLTEVYLMSDKTIEDLISEIRNDISVLYKASESIAMLDMLTSFAHQCTVSNYVRPEFTDTLAIKAGRNPMRESLYVDTFVPNDTYASSATNFQLITGPNMSGKSTYLRQIALMSIMSQIGSYVPAEYASFRIVDQLFTRICNDDNIESNASTFVVEMRETAYILQNVTDDSLVIIDELGRGTSTHDGLGITYAICEELLKTKAFIFFATHFHELTRSLTVYPNVVNLHLEVEIEEEDSRVAMKYLYRVKDGRNDEEHYGLKFGQIIGLPENVIRKATEVSYKAFGSPHYLDHKEELRKYLKMVQEEFITKMEALF